MVLASFLDSLQDGSSLALALLAFAVLFALVEALDRV